jgi:hypothetical protein
MKGIVGLGVALAAAMSLGAGVAQANVAPSVDAPAHIAAVEDTQVALNGFTFADADAGVQRETVTLSVDSGRLWSSAPYVRITGQGTSTLTLRGSMNDLDAAFTNGSTTYQDARDANGTHTLHVTLDDEGNAGGGALTATADVALDVAAVNDAPVVTKPLAEQQVDQDAPLAFSAANGNRITVADVDAAGSALEVTLTATHGTLTLSGTSGLSFSTGTGTADATMTFQGEPSDVRAALDGLVYTPAAGYTGAATLQVDADDLGNTGTGGALTDTQTVALNVASPTPYVVDIRPDGFDGMGYGMGSTFVIDVWFNRPVTVSAGSVPTLLLNTAPVQHAARYIGGGSTSGFPSRELQFTFTPQHGDVASPLDVASGTALQIDPGAIASMTTGIAALTTTPYGSATGSLAPHDLGVNAVQGYITGVDYPRAGVYGIGAALDFTVHFDRPVKVSYASATARPRIRLSWFGDEDGWATAISPEGVWTDTVTFRHTVAAGEVVSGRAIDVDNQIDLVGAHFTGDTPAHNPIVTWPFQPKLTGVTIDGVAPTVTGLAHDHDLSWTLMLDKAVTGVDPSDFDVVTTGTAAARTVSVDAVDAKTYRVTLRDTSGAGTVAPRLRDAGTGIADVAGNGPRSGATGPAWGVWPAPAPVVTQPAPRPVATPAAKARPRLRTATIASSCTKARTLALTLAGTGAARVEVKVAALKTTARQRGCSGLAKLRTGKAVGTAKRLTVRAGTNHIKYRHGLRPGAYVVTFTPIAADGTRGTALTRRIRILK